MSASDGQWTEGIYENQLVKEGGVWKFSAVHFYPTFITDYDKGWAKDAKPAPGPLAALPPDRPPTERYAIYPKQHIPPFHYPNPVTGTSRLHVSRGQKPAPRVTAAVTHGRIDARDARRTARGSAGTFAWSTGPSATSARVKDYARDREPGERLRLLPGQEPVEPTWPTCSHARVPSNSRSAVCTRARGCASS